MDNFKQALLAYYNKALDFLLKKNENSKIKYKNLTVCSIGLLVFILICLMLVPSKQNNNTMMLHPEDISSANEEVSFADNNAVAVSPTVDETSLQLQNKQQTEATAPKEELQRTEPATDLPEYEATDNELSKTEENIEITKNQDIHGTFLYCGKFSSQKEASEHKANLAFSAGMISSVVEKSGTYTLKLGPFDSRDNAVKAFEKMDKLSLVDECQLETE